MTVTLQLEHPPQTPDEFSRADLQFRGVDHSGPSFQARISLDNPKAVGSTPMAEEEGYAGSFHVFGHGGCFGALGHCALREAPQGVYDHRLAHPLTPQFKTVMITDALRRVMRTSSRKTISVAVVPIVPDNPASWAGAGDPLRFESVSLLVDQDPN